MGICALIGCAADGDDCNSVDSDGDGDGSSDDNSNESTWSSRLATNINASTDLKPSIAQCFQAL